MANLHYHGNSCLFLGWASTSQQKWGLFVQISFLAVHEKNTGSSPDATLALQKHSDSVTLLLVTTIAGQWWVTAASYWMSENTGSACRHNYCIAYKGWANIFKSPHAVSCNPTTNTTSVMSEVDNPILVHNINHGTAKTTTNLITYCITPHVPFIFIVNMQL